MSLVLAKQKIEGFYYNSDAGTYLRVLTPSPCILELEKKYIIYWDNTEYICTSFTANINGYDMIAVGNTILADGENTNIPFAIAYNSTTNYLNIFAMTNDTSHTIEISLNEETRGVSVILYDQTGEAINYDNIETITTDTPVAEKGATFTYGTAVDNAEYEPDFTDGNQKVSLEKGQLLKEFTLVKPNTLIPENIKNNVDVAGVVGALTYIEEIETEEEMSALLVSENIGNAYKFIGESSDTYVNGDIYVVEDNS